MLNSPFEILNNAVPYPLGMSAGLPTAPRSFHQLYAGAAPLDVLRSDDRTLELRARDGWGDRPVGRIMCATRDIPRVGDIRNVLGMQVRVLESTPLGLPARVQFRFVSSLDDPARAWLVWRDHAPVRWWPPAIGAHARVAGVSLLDAATLKPF